MSTHICKTKKIKATTRYGKHTNRDSNISNSINYVKDRSNEIQVENILNDPIMSISDEVQQKSWQLDGFMTHWHPKWGQENIDVLHNQMLNSYGVPTDEIAIIRADKNIEKLSDTHYKRTSKKVMGKNGNLYQYCIKMKGSHEMTTKEMTFLINGLINEIIGSGADRDIDISGVDRW